MVSEVKSNDDLTLSSAATKDVKIKSRNVTYTMPTSDGTANQSMVTDGNGQLSFKAGDANKITAVKTSDMGSGLETQKMYGPTLIEVFDYNVRMPNNALQRWDMIVPTSVASGGEKIESFTIKGSNLNFAFVNGIGSINQCWVDGYILPLQGNGASNLTNDTQFNTRFSQYWTGGSSSLSSNNDTSSSGKNHQWARNGGTTTYFRMEDVGYKWFNGNACQMGINPNGSSSVNVRQAIDNPWSMSDGVRNNDWQVDFNFELNISNRDQNWTANSRFNYQVPGSWYNSGYAGFGESRTHYTYNSTSSYHPVNNNHSEGVRFSLLPYSWSTANHSAGGSTNQVEATHFGLASGRLEFWATIKPF